MANENICPRLIDYLAIVGLRNPNKSSNRNNVVPELLRRYPHMDHKNGGLPQDVVYFCQPDGCINSCSSRSAAKESNTFIFTLTDKETGRVRYGICMNFLRPIERRSPIKVTRTSQERLGSASSVEMSTVHSGSTSVNRDQNNRSSQRVKRRTHSLTSLLIVSHHPCFRGFQVCLSILREIIEKFEERTKRRSNGRDSVWPTLLGSSAESSNSVIHHDVMEIETWIFRLLSSPVPVAGITRIELSLLPETVMRPVIFALPDNDRFPLVDFPLHTIFALMGVEFALKLFFAVLLENKVILQSKNYKVLSTSILALKALLYPLEYMFPISTLLPTHMPSAEQLFTAPSPFIFGIPSSFLSARKSFRMPSDVWFFDLDLRQLLRQANSKMVPQSNIENDLCLPPAFEYNILIKHIKQALNSISDQCEPVKNLDEIMNNVELQSLKPSQSEISGFNPLIFGNDSDTVDISTRVAMVRFFNSPSILGNYTKFTRVLKLYPRPIVAFQVENFIKSRRIQSEFIKKLSKTQAVQFFCEWNISPKNTVFFQILSEKYDPRIIGDKSKWFDQNLEPINFKVYRENGSCTLHLLFNQDSNVESECPTDESGSDSDDISDSSSSNRELTETCSDLADSGISECQRLTVDPTKIYYPPTYLQIPSISIIDTSKDPLSQVKTQSTSRQCVASDSEEIVIKKRERETKRQQNLANKHASRDKLGDSDSLSYTIVTYDTDNDTNFSSTSDTFKKSSHSGSIVSANSNNSYTEFWNETSKKLTGFIGNSLSPSRPSLSPEILKTNPSFKPYSDKKSIIDRGELTNKLKEAHNDSRRSSTSSFFFPNRKSIDHENQEFIQQITDEVLKGSTPNIISKYRIKNLVENESYRNLILSRINRNLDKNSNCKETFINDIAIESEDHFNALVWICKVLVTGIENSYNKGICDGFGSVFVILEMLYTHYVERKLVGSSISLSSVNASPMTSNNKKPYHESMPNVNMVPSIGAPLNINGEEYETIEMKKEQKIAQLFSESNSGFEETQSMFSPHQSSSSSDVIRKRGSNVVPKTLNLRSETSSVVSFKDNEISALIDYTIPCKSSISLGYRYRLNQLYYIRAPQLPREISPQRNDKFSPKEGSFFARILNSPSRSYDVRSAPVTGSHSSDNGFVHIDSALNSKIYLFQKLILKNDRSKIWDNMAFWEDAFYDAVCQEREIIGLDQNSTDLMDRYNSLDISEKQRLERNEDRLLGIVMNNFIAFMIMMFVDPAKIKSKARCMIGKSHIALDESANINKLIDSIKYLRGNDVELLVNLSRQQDVQLFPVYCGINNQGDLFVAEVHTDCMLLRSISGVIVARWWLERFIKCTSKKNVICISRRENNEIIMTQLYCKKSKELIQAIQRHSEKFKRMTEPDISQFKVTDDVTKCSGLLKIDKDGLIFSSESTDWFVDFINVRRCFTKKPDRFIVEILDPNTKNLTYRIFKSFSYDQIAYSVLTKFSLLSTNRPKHSHHHLSPVSKSSS